MTSHLDIHQVQFIKLIRENAHRHRLHEVFSDFCEMAALAISNSVDPAQYEAREARYLQLVGRYERPEVERFPRMLACVVESLEAGMHDCLGELFMSLEMGDRWRGQFFTPWPVATLMARMVGVDRADIKQRGFVTLNEPACGAGCMVIATAEAMREAGINYQQHLHATAIDIDATAAHMAYIQLSLLHVPALIVHGNALWPEKTSSNWFTPAHVLGSWDSRLASARAFGAARELVGHGTLDKQAADSVDVDVDELDARVAPGSPDVDLGRHRDQLVAARLQQLDLF